jgi:hypothetical protein
MQNRKTPPVSGALQNLTPTPSIKIFSDNNQLTMQELLLLIILATWEECLDEPEELKDLRARIKSAHLACDHLIHEGLSPILPKFEFEALKRGA